MQAQAFPFQSARRNQAMCNGAGSNSAPKTLTKLLALALFGITTTLAGATYAAEFTIQVGAFKNPSQAFADEIRQYGEVNTAQNSKGITVFTVGRYQTMEQASAALASVHSTHPGAFVRNMPASARRPTFNEQEAPKELGTNSTASTNSHSVATQAPDAGLWESLTDAERRRVVYLDGVLHLKQGDNFVPLTEYRRSQTQ